MCSLTDSLCFSVYPLFFTSADLLCSLQRSQRNLSPPQGRCTRDNCKYLHPPPHLKTQLEINGRNNLIQQKAAAAMLAQQMQFMLPGAQLQPIVSSSSPRTTTFFLIPVVTYKPALEMKCDLCPNAKVRLIIFKHCLLFLLVTNTKRALCSEKMLCFNSLTCFSLLVFALHSVPQTTFPMTPSLATSPSMAFSPYLNHMGPGMGLMPELLPSTPLLVPGSPTGLAAMANGTSSQKHGRTDKLEVREPASGRCVWPQRDEKQTFRNDCKGGFIFYLVLPCYCFFVHPVCT